jgi:hypothetical protein
MCIANASGIENVSACQLVLREVRDLGRHVGAYLWLGLLWNLMCSFPGHLLEASLVRKEDAVLSGPQSCVYCGSSVAGAAAQSPRGCPPMVAFRGECEMIGRTKFLDLNI